MHDIGQSTIESPGGTNDAQNERYHVLTGKFNDHVQLDHSDDA
jgi:hypothetical protein